MNDSAAPARGAYYLLVAATAGAAVLGLEVLAAHTLPPGGVVAVEFIGDDGPWSARIAARARAVFGGDGQVLAPCAEPETGPRWLFAGAAPLPSDDFWAAGATVLPWRDVTPPATCPPATDDHFGGELDWARVAARWRSHAAR
jgi:hypothetical protein